MKPLTIDYILQNSSKHPTAAFRSGNARQFKLRLGDYLLSIVGGGVGLYGDFEETFEVAVIDESTGNFATRLFSKRADDILPYATIEEINEIFYLIPRKKFPD